MLRQSDFNGLVIYICRNPVHFDIIRILLVQCVYGGPGKTVRLYRLCGNAVDDSLNVVSKMLVDDHNVY